MLRVGLTGGVASGKSTVGKMMEARGAYVIQADIIAHELMRPGEPLYDEVVKRFGQSIVNKNDLGSIDRTRLGAIVFGEGRIVELNQLIHPAVIRRQEEWMAEIGRKDPQAIAVVEAALIVEAGVNGRFDMLIMIACPEEERRRRFVARAAVSLGIAEEAATERFRSVVAAQLPDEAKAAAADRTIDNSGTLEETEREVDGLMRRLHTLAAAK
jgi:dephospho-CoA kinase